MNQAMRIACTIALAGTLSWAGTLSLAGTAVAKTDKSEAKKTDQSKKPVVAVFSLKGLVAESPAAEDLFLGSSQRTTMRQLITRLKKTKDDDRVKAVVLLVSQPMMGPAQIEEFRQAMDEVQQAGKKIYVHVDSLSTSSYVLCSGASHLSVVPTGDLFVTGLYGEQLFVRELLDKLKIRPDFLTCGKYKSAAEMFMRNQPSDEAARMYSWLFDGLYGSYVKMIAEGRGVPSEKVRAWIDGALYSAESARKEGMIDAVEHRQAFEARLKKAYGDDIRFDKKYGRKKRADLDFSSPFGVFKFWADLFQGPKAKKPSKAIVAVVHVDGPILPGAPQPSPFGSQGIAYSTPIRKALDKVTRDKNVKAVVLRVSSPGGSAVASEIILNATRRVKQAKPFAVSMGNVAGSGGYYVACGADTIFADGATITGSIGVVGGKFATTEMWKQWGIHWTPIARGKNAGMLSSSKGFTQQQREKLESWMEEIYAVFKGHVEKIRKDRLKKPIDQVAGGRVYTGRQALELGLVDRIGGLDAAIDYVADEAGLEAFEVQVVPRPKNFMEMLFSELSDGEEDDQGTIQLSQGSRGPVAGETLIERALPLLRSLDPTRAAAVFRALKQLELLQSEGVALAMPEIIVHEPAR